MSNAPEPNTATATDAANETDTVDPAYTLVFDGDCAFCTRCVDWLRALRLGGPGLTIVAWQHADLASLGLTPAACAAALQWVAPSGRISAGHEAIARLLRASAPPWRPLGVVLLTPPVSWLAARVYRWVAANRDRMPGGTAACAVPTTPAPPPTSAGEGL